MRSSDGIENWVYRIYEDENVRRLWLQRDALGCERGGRRDGVERDGFI